jgi:hypothetical protein
MPHNRQMPVSVGGELVDSLMMTDQSGQSEGDSVDSTVSSVSSVESESKFGASSVESVESKEDRRKFNRGSSIRRSYRYQLASPSSDAPLMSHSDYSHICCCPLCPSIPLSLCPSAPLPLCAIPYYPTTLLPYNPTTQQPKKTTTLLPYYPTTLLLRAAGSRNWQSSTCERLDSATSPSPRRHLCPAPT